MAAESTLTVVPTAEAMGRLAADRVAAVIARAPDAAITVPTGETPRGMYRELVRRVHDSELDLSRTHIYCLDEYLGVTADDPNSLTGWLYREFLVPGGIRETNIHPLPSADPDPATAAARYEAELIAQGGLDLAIVGLGPNGHVAYNEPGSAADSRSRVVDLTPESIAQASAYWEDTVPIPDRAMTIGVGTILAARQLILIVSGESKADILCRALGDPPSAAVPASWLRLAGDRLEIIADAAAASSLPPHFLSF